MEELISPSSYKGPAKRNSDVILSKMGSNSSSMRLFYIGCLFDLGFGIWEAETVIPGAPKAPNHFL